MLLNIKISSYAINAVTVKLIILKLMNKAVIVKLTINKRNLNFSYSETDNNK